MQIDIQKDFDALKALGTSNMGVATFVQGTVVQGDLGPRDKCPSDGCPRRLWSEETFVQGSFHQWSACSNYFFLFSIGYYDIDWL